MLKEIRQQPEHIRAIFMWLSVFIVFSLVVFVWFRGFERKISLLINEPEKESGMAEQRSPASVITGSFRDLRATIIDLFGLAAGSKKEVEVKNNFEDRFGEKIEPNLLPVSE